MTRREAVRRAIRCEDPGRIPVFLFNGGPDSDTDICQFVLEDWYLGPRKDLTEWGFYWNKDESDPMGMGVPRNIVLPEWDCLEEYKKTLAPDPFRADRWRESDAADVGDRYRMGSLYLTGFTVMTFLRGFENLLADLYEEPDRVRELGEYVFGLENEIIRQMPAHGFDGVSLFDDWGTQRALMISPVMWREFFLPLYKKQFDLIHSLGMEAFFHCCGDIRPIIGDLFGAGCDMLNLGQPDLNDPEACRRLYAGRNCFALPINYQKTGISGTKEQIYAEARELVRCFGGPRGGFIAEVFDYGEMGWKADDPRNSGYTKTCFTEQDFSGVWDGPGV